MIEHEGHSHGHHTGVRWLDLILAGSAIFISVVSLVISIHHGRTMEQLPGGPPFRPALTKGGTSSSYFSTGRPKHSTYLLLSMTSKALSPSLVLASSRCMGTCLAVNSAYSASGSSVWI